VSLLLLNGSGWACALVADDGVSGEAVTLESALQQSITLFRNGRYQDAVSAFDALETVFGREAEYVAGSVQRVVLPMRGYATLASGDSAAAIDHLTRYLEHFRERSKVGSLVLFSLAQALQAEGLNGLSLERFQEFIENYPGTSEAGIAYLRVAELQVASSDRTAALETLNRLYQSPHPLVLRQKARLMALQIAADGVDRNLAVRYLLETSWDLEAMPELGALAFLAVGIGDYLLGAERFEQAVAAYRLVPEQTSLLARQKELLADLRDGSARNRRFAAEGEVGIWAAYHQTLFRRIELLINQVEQGTDYTAPVYLRYGQAFSGAGRHHEAWIVFAELAEDSACPVALRQEAHYRWIFAAQELARWEDGLRIGMLFVDRYPAAPQAPMALFLIANAHQELGDYPAAVALLTRLLTEYPGHPFHARWLFTRGYVRLLQEKNADARADFRAYLDAAPEAALALHASLWHALSWYFEKAHQEALAELDVLLQETPEDHHLRGEVEYRRSSVLYALRDYAGALEQLEHYLARFPEHGRRTEAQVLRGDTLMGLGRLVEASVAFRQVGSEAGNLFPYAVFQTGKIYRALEEYALMAKHFAAYVARDDLVAHPRVSEALYWIGWAHQQQGQLTSAFPVFEEALVRFGNDPNALEIGSILKELHKLHRQLQAPREPNNHGARGVLSFPSFMDWITAEQGLAREEKRWTYYSRLRLYEVERKAAGGQFLLEELGETVPLEALDAEGLAKVGLAWQEAGRTEARQFFDALLEHYPQSPERAAGYLGLGRIAFAEADYALAGDLLGRLIAELPGHPLAIEGTLLYGRAQLALREPDKAVPVLEELLRLKSARGRPHAEALILLGEAAEGIEQCDRAIAYYQRVYNMYRAYPDLVGAAYLRSARLFEQADDLTAAWRTYREIIYFEDLAGSEVRKEAERAFERLTPLLPPEAVNAPQLTDLDGGAT